MQTLETRLRTSMPHKPHQRNLKRNRNNNKDSLAWVVINNKYHNKDITRLMGVPAAMVLLVVTTHLKDMVVTIHLNSSNTRRDRLVAWEAWEAWEAWVPWAMVR